MNSKLYEYNTVLYNLEKIIREYFRVEDFYADKFNDLLDTTLTIKENKSYEYNNIEMERKDGILKINLPHSIEFILSNDTLTINYNKDEYYWITRTISIICFSIHYCFVEITINNEKLKAIYSYKLAGDEIGAMATRDELLGA